jgi:NADH:ubiquinone oxidoreductase subunit 5 (subunit L)/multisubunit Na+/H+ antiporter MnhA subunit
MSPESLWFRIIAIIGSGVFTGFFIANAIYWNRVRSSSHSVVSNGEANAFMWINIILAVLSAIIFIWGIITLFTHQSKTTKESNEMKAKIKTKQMQREIKTARTSTSNPGAPASTSAPSVSRPASIPVRRA